MSGSRDIPQALSGILQPRLQAPSEDGSFGSNKTDAGTPGKRKVVLVGHSVAHDIESIKLLGYNAYNNDQLLEIVDTAYMHQHMGRWINPSSLGNILDNSASTTGSCTTLGTTRYTLCKL